jgi:hypothetical protein
MTIDKLLDAGSMASLMQGASVMNMASAGGPARVHGMKQGNEMRLGPRGFYPVPKRNNP